MNLSASPGRPACPSRASGWSSCPRLGVSRVAYAFLVYMLSPLPRRSGWTYCFAHSLQPYQPSPKGSSGRPAHRPFRGLLGVHSRYGLHTRAVPVYRDTLTRGFSHFVTSMTAPVASGWSSCRVGLAPTGKRRLSTAHTQTRHRRTYDHSVFSLLKCLFNHLVGECEQRRRLLDAERLGGLQVDQELEPGGAHDRQVGRLLALEDAADV